MKKPTDTSKTMDDPLESMRFIADGMDFGGSRAIEMQEERGQRELVKSDTLPTDGLLGERWNRGVDYRPRLEALGFKILDKVEGDDMFTYVQLPPGWKKDGTGHSMWSKLFDQNGCERASMFYKAAFYDRSAHMSYSLRFTVSRQYSDYYQDQKRGAAPAGPKNCASYEWVELFDNKTKQVVHRSETQARQGRQFDQKAYERMEAIERDVRIGLQIGYPQCGDPFAYWEE